MHKPFSIDEFLCFSNFITSYCFTNTYRIRWTTSILTNKCTKIRNTPDFLIHLLLNTNTITVTVHTITVIVQMFLEKGADFRLSFVYVMWILSLAYLVLRKFRTPWTLIALDNQIVNFFFNFDIMKNLHKKTPKYNVANTL